MGNVRPLDEHTPVQGIPLGLGAPASESRVMDFEDLRQRQEARVPAWLLAVALLGGGGAGGGVSALLAGGHSDDIMNVQLEQAAHRTRLDAHDSALEAAADRHSATQRWLADVLVRQSAAIGGIAEKVGAKVDVTVPQYMAEGR